MIKLKRFLHRLLFVLSIACLVALMTMAFGRIRVDESVYFVLSGASVVSIFMAYVLRPTQEEGGIMNMVISIVSGTMRLITFIFAGLASFLNFVNEELEPFVKAGKEVPDDTKKKKG